MKKYEVANIILANKPSVPVNSTAQVFAPTNIALCKYWGKRDDELNLPVTSSLSVAIPDKGAQVTLHTRTDKDIISINGQLVAENSSVYSRATAFLDLFRQKDSFFLQIEYSLNIPMSAGLASSACSFAALTKALNELFAWQLPEQSLSILARMGSGSAARSLWPDFVEWHAGTRADGMDSYAEPLPYQWPELCLGILVLSDKEKSISSREAMKRCVNTSRLYAGWPDQVAHDMKLLHKALANKDFDSMGSTAEANALAMHALTLTSWPPICFSSPETIATWQKIWALRASGLKLYFTQDAGPNLILLFLAKDIPEVLNAFPTITICRR